jgi:hypothetical protein
VSATTAPLVSVAVTLRLRLPTSALPGIPLKEPVTASKVSQLGKELPFSMVAE